MKTTRSIKAEEVERQWHLIDAEGQVLGRLATRVSDILRGKDKPIYTPHVDAGDFVVVINAEKVKLTGNKLEQKKYYHHSTWPGGMRVRSAKEMLAKKPEDVIRLAVKGMLPKNTLNRHILTKLKIYAGPEHPHLAQQPKPLKIGKE
jgi:large subunit ribosomal protein L13